MIEIDSAIELDNQRTYANSDFQHIHGSLRYDTFFVSFMQKNKPCNFSSALTEEWNGRKEWVTCDARPNYKYLLENFGTAPVPVADCNLKQYDSQPKKTFLFKEYVDYLEKRTIQTNLSNLYLKDWHFVKSFPNRNIYCTPKYFASDWLNEFWSLRSDENDDYRFVYIGPKGSWTPLHCDVFRSYSWSANLCGLKKWIFFPPTYHNELRNKFGKIIYDLYDSSRKDDLLTEGITVVQKPGEIVFVPSGWYHQVWNLEDTISINHNWINGTNIDMVWEHLQTSLTEVEEAISDCKDMNMWEEHCQLMLKSIHGMDFHEYYRFLDTIAARRMDAVKRGYDVEVLDGCTQGHNHTMYDLRRLQWAVTELVNSDKLDFLPCFKETEKHPTKLLDQLNDVL